MTQAQEASAKIATRRKAPKQLRFRDLLFISFGQAPLISMLTFGTAMMHAEGVQLGELRHGPMVLARDQCPI